MNLNFNKIKDYTKEDVIWKLILESIPEDTILFFDVEVYPLVENEITQEHKIIAVGVGYQNKIDIMIGDEKEVLRWFNEFISNKEIYLTVGYGSMHLDVPILLLKLRTYRNLLALRRVLNKTPHLDLVYPTGVYLYAIGKTQNVKLVSLKEALELLGLGSKNFSEDIYKDQDKLKEYITNDIKCIINLFNTLKENYFNAII